MATVELPDSVAARLAAEAQQLGQSVEERLVEVLDPAVAPDENLAPGAMEGGLGQLRSFLEQIPAVEAVVVSDPAEPYWWVKFRIDLHSALAWNVVPELGFVLNYISLTDPLPTVFMPVSPPPYLNGGPEAFLSWVIEARIPFLDAGNIADILSSRLPSPIDNLEAWSARNDIG